MSEQSIHLGQQAAPDPLAAELPAPIDSETAVLLRGFLLSVFEQARSWEELRRTLSAKGYVLGFRSGHLVVIDDRGHAVCTGSMLGAPLSVLSARLGRPRIRSDAGGASGQLRA